MVTEAQYKQAQQTIKLYKQQLKDVEPKECKHYGLDWVVEEQRYVCPCGFKGPIYIRKV
jgi:hypothetical protein